MSSSNHTSVCMVSEIWTSIGYGSYQEGLRRKGLKNSSASWHSSKISFEAFPANPEKNLEICHYSGRVYVCGLYDMFYFVVCYGITDKIVD